MIFIFLFLNIFLTHGFQLFMNNVPKNTNWKTLQFSLKEKARNWFVGNAIKKGIPWNELTADYEKNKTDILVSKISKEDVYLNYPDYYLMPFHGYDDGNMNWRAANEAEAATLSIGSGYWKNVDPYTAQDWLRYNISKNIKDYIENVNHIYDYIPYNALDVGCSIGISTEFLIKDFPKTQMYGIDLSPYFIGVADYRSSSNNLNIEYVHGNAEKTKFHSNSFQLIVCNFLFHELPEKAAKTILNELYRILSDNGVLAIIDMDPSHLDKQLNNNIFRKWAFESTEPHIYNYYLRNSSTMLRNANFDQVKKIRNDPLNSIWFGVKRSSEYHSENVLSNRFKKSLDDLYSENSEHSFEYEFH